MPEQFTAQRIQPGTPLGDSITLGDVGYKQWSALRAKLTGAQTIRPLVRALVLVDREVVGGFGVKLDTTTPKGSLPGPVAELISFAEPGLERLVLLAAISSEARAWIERVAGRRVRSVVTTVLADDAAVDEDHRMVFHVVERRVTRRRGKPNTQAVVFGRQLGPWTLAEALDSWREIYG